MTQKITIDEKANFEELQAEISAALDTGDAHLAVALIKNIEYGALIANESLDESGSMLFKAVRDHVYSAKFNNKSWEKTATALNEILEAVQEEWSKTLLDKAVNSIGNSFPKEDGTAHTETMRDLIEQDDTYQGSHICRVKFNTILHKYDMMKKENVLNHKARSQSISV